MFIYQQRICRDYLLRRMKLSVCFSRENISYLLLYTLIVTVEFIFKRFYLLFLLINTLNWVMVVIHSSLNAVHQTGIPSILYQTVQFTIRQASSFAHFPFPPPP
ncbi:hypothetical protein FGO68_gene985 [Halteria grandinella]|uniref:Uncharacterized protein n=1 Tax=Halteria grandinella TaxID=5974 RepID=A0A8J8SXW0_HALGN|nr:hypothetical protein FGO68_gene985 [Halteria grandinella]